MSKIPVYFVPGLGASPLIFEFIDLPKDEFECIYFKWEVPNDNETLKEYAQRYCKKITHEKPVLIGVSFGGLVVQEMATCMDAGLVIIISSAKCNTEYPSLFRFSKKAKAHKILPTSLLIKLGSLAKFQVFGRKVNERLRLYKRYLGIKDKKFWDWAIDKVIYWEREVADEKVIHIHGTADEIFPAANIKNFIPVPDGTHVMLIIKHKWISEHLPDIIRKNLNNR